MLKGIMSARVQENSPAFRYLPWFLSFAYFLLGLGSISGGHAWGDDWAQYVMHGQALAEARPYGDIGYVFNPDAPNVGPPRYPPGLPLLLAPVLAAFGVNLVLLKVACFICVAAALPFLFRLLSASCGGVVASISVALFALHDQIWALRDVIGSEAPYILFTVLTLWYATRTNSRSIETWSSVRDGLILGVLAYASVACRSIGVTLLAALLLYGWAQSKPLAWFVTLIAGFSLLIALQNLLLVMPPTYSNELTLPTFGLLADNLSGYWFALGAMFRQPFGLARLAAAVVAGFVLLGAWGVSRRRSGPDLRPRNIRRLTARVPLLLWYMVLYVGALVLAAISPNDRYLLPVLPFVIALAATGVGVLARRVSHAERYVLPLALALGLYYAALHASAPRLRADELANCEACEEMYASVRTHSAPEAIVAFAKPRAMSLATGRPSWMWSPEYTAGELRKRLQEVGATMLVIVAPGHALGEKYPATLDFDALTKDPGADVVFQNGMFTVVRFTAGSGMQGAERPKH